MPLDSTRFILKVLKTVNRILAALQDCYPGIFVTAKDTESRKSTAMEELVESEHIHVGFLRMVIVSNHTIRVHYVFQLLICVPHAGPRRFSILRVKGSRNRPGICGSH